VKNGDLVRFRRSYEPYKTEAWLIGLLVVYEPAQKIGTVLYNGTLIRLRAADIQLAGRKDSENILNR